MSSFSYVTAIGSCLPFVGTLFSSQSIIEVDNMTNEFTELNGTLLPYFKRKIENAKLQASLYFLRGLPNTSGSNLASSQSELLERGMALDDTLYGSKVQRHEELKRILPPMTKNGRTYSICLLVGSALTVALSVNFAVNRLFGRTVIWGVLALFSSLSIINLGRRIAQYTQNIQRYDEAQRATQTR